MTTAVTVDGVWSAGEWDDAAEVHVTSGAEVDFEYYLYVKNDGTWIYVCMDVVGDTTLDDSDMAYVIFDTGHDEVLTDGGEDGIGQHRGPASVAHMIHDLSAETWGVHCSSTSSVSFTDDGRDEAGMVAASGFAGTPNSGLYHSIWEFKIPMALGDLNAYPGYTAGIWLCMYEPTRHSYWPVDSYIGDASTLGDLVLASQPAGPIIYSEWMTTAVTVDGVWSAGEWEDAAEVHVTSGAEVDFEYYLYVKNDGTWIYVCMDVVGDTTQDISDIGNLLFDTGNDAMLTHYSEDYIHCVGDGINRHFLYDAILGYWAILHCTSTSGVPFTDHGRDETGTVAVAGFGESPNSDGGSLNHRIYELKIPMALGDLNVHPGYTAGIWVYLWDGSSWTDSCWPVDSSWTDPSSLGDLVLASQPTEPIIYSSWMTTAVTVDGVWSFGEWDDASEVHVTSGASVDFEYYLYVKNDDNWIYLCVDVVGDITLDDYDYCFFSFDTGHDEVFTDGREDAVAVRGLMISRHLIYNDVAGQWDPHCTSSSGVPFTDDGRDEAGMVSAAGFAGTPNSDLGSLYHRVYEFKVPMALGDLNAYLGYTAGCHVWISDESADRSDWPPNLVWQDASTWGDLVLASGSCAMSEIDTIIFGAPADSVYFVPTGNIYDDSAFYAFYGHAENPQIITSPTQSAASSAYLDGDGSPLFSGHIVTFGGRYANRLVAYFEDAGLALVGFANNGTHRIFKRVSDGSHLYAVDSSTYDADEKDYLVFQFFRDGDRYVLSEWGFGARGTYAGGLCFINQICPNMEDYTDSYYVFSWTDLNADGMPQPEEIELEAWGS